MKSWLAVLWIATWTQTMHKIVKCPADGAGGTCTRDVVTKQERRFATEQAAREFIAECPKNVCSDWVLEEVHE